MTTVSATKPKSNDPPFSYAAAASGKSASLKSTAGSQTVVNNGNASTSPAGPRSTSPSAEATSTTSAKGILNPNSIDAPSQPAPTASIAEKPSPALPQVSTTETSSRSRGNKAPDASGSNAVASSTGGTFDNENASNATTKEKDEMSSTSGAEDPKSEWESKPVVEEPEKDAPKYKELVPAPVPSVNPWTARKEKIAQSKTQAPQTSISLPTSPIGKSMNDRPDARAGDRRPGKPTFGGFESDKDKSSGYGAGADRKDTGRERRKAPEPGKERTGSGAKDDSSRYGKSGPRASKNPPEKSTTKEPAVPLLPPPLADTTSWPTPETAQDEEKKERREREEKEKDKPVVTVSRAGKEKWVNVPVTPNIIYNTPLPTKGSRGGRLGRGGGTTGERTGRSYQTGVNSGDKSSATTQRASSAEERDRGRQNYTTGETRGGRGGYQGNRPRRSGSVGSNPQTKESVKPANYEKRKEAETPVVALPVTTSSSAREKATPAARAPAPQVPSSNTQAEKPLSEEVKKQPEEVASARPAVVASNTTNQAVGGSNASQNNFSYNGSNYSGGVGGGGGSRPEKVHQNQQYRRENTTQTGKPHYSGPASNNGSASYGNKYEGKYEGKYDGKYDNKYESKYENKYDHSNQDQSYYKEGGYGGHSHRERGPGRGGYRGSRGGASSNTAFFGNHSTNHGSHNNSNANSSNPQYGNNAPTHHLDHRNSASQLSGHYHQPPQSAQSPQFPPSPQVPPQGRGNTNFRNGQRSQSAPQQQQQPGYNTRFSLPIPFQQIPFIQTAPYQQFYEYGAPANLQQPQLSPMAPFMMGGDQGQTAIVLDMVANQINYYFSVDNLCKDMFLRKHMDTQGWVPLQVIASFNRIKNLTTDFTILCEACKLAQNAEFKATPDGMPMVRARVNPAMWILEMDKRDPTAQNDGPNWNFRTQQQSQSQPQFPIHFGQFAPNNNNSVAHQNELLPHMDPTMQEQKRHKSLSSGAPSFIPSSSQNAQAQVSQASHLQTAPATNGNRSTPQDEEDQFPDDKVNLLVLIIRKYSHEFGTKDSSTLTNGNMEDINEELRNFENQIHASREDYAGGVSERDEEHIRFFPSSPKPSSSTPSPESTYQANEVGWFVDPSIGNAADSKPFTTTYTYHPFSVFRSETLKRRSEAGPTNTPELETLYRFFSHFLRQQFNNGMYEEFKRIAIEDFRAGVSMGLEYLFKFYEAKSLQQTAHDSIYKDFATLANGNFPGFRYGLQKLKAVLESNEISAKPKQKLETQLDEMTRKAMGELSLSA